MIPMTKKQKIFRLEFQINQVQKNIDYLLNKHPLSGMITVGKMRKAIEVRQWAIDYLKELIRTNSKENPTMKELEKKYKFNYGMMKNKGINMGDN